MKVIKIGAVWCSGCVFMKPRWEKAEKNNSWLETEYYDYDNDYKIIEKYNIGDRIPVFIFLDKNEAEVTRIIGEISYKKIIELISKYRDM